MLHYACADNMIDTYYKYNNFKKKLLKIINVEACISTFKS